MTGDRGIIFDHEELANRIRKGTDEVMALLATPIGRRLFGPEALERLRAQHDLVLEHVNERLSVVVLGDFKRGKSTLVNSLLNAAAVPTDVTPETVTINRLEYGDTPGAEVDLPGGARLRIAPDDLRRERLSLILAKAKLPVATTVRVRVPSAMLLDMSLIDTPGLGDLMSTFEAPVTRYLLRADALIYVVSATSPLSDSEQAYLRSVVRPLALSRLLVVVNQSDVLETTEDVDRVRKLVVDRLSRILPGTEVYMLSALDEWCRQQGAVPPNPARTEELGQAFRAFRARIDESVRRSRDSIRHERALYRLARFQVELEKEIARLRHGLQLDADKARAEIARIEGKGAAYDELLDHSRAELQKALGGMAEEATNWMLEFIGRIENQLLSDIASIPAAQVRQHVQFFLADRLRDGMSACMAAHHDEIGVAYRRAAEGFGSAIGEDFTRSAAQPTTGKLSIPSIADDGWSAVDTVRIAATALPVGSVVSAVAVAIGQRAKSDDNFQRSLRSVLDQTRTTLPEAVAKAYGRIAEELLHALESSHEQERAAMLPSLRSAQEALGKGDDSRAELLAYLDDVSGCFSNARTRLENEASTIWPH